jgi:hypothetical protein
LPLAGGYRLRSARHKTPAQAGAVLIMTVINRTQALVLGFFVLAWAALIAILVVTPQVYDRALRQAPGSQPAAEIVFAAGLSGLIAVVCAGVVRRRRWAFWLTLIALSKITVSHPLAGRLTWSLSCLAAFVEMAFDLFNACRAAGSGPQGVQGGGDRCRGCY